MEISIPKRQKSERSAYSSLSDLPVELLSLVAQHLSYYDFVRFGAVCKQCCQAVRAQGRPTNHMPWAVTYACFEHGGQYFSVLELSDLWTEQTYSVGQIIREEDRKLLVGAEVHASKNSWLLLSKVNFGQKLYAYSIGFFFYSPFRNKTIRLPSLPIKVLPSTYSSCRATFTVAPNTNSEDKCAVFVITQTDRDMWTVRECNLSGDTPTWKTIYSTTHLGDHLGDTVKELIYIEGTLFCALYDSFVPVAVINIVDKVSDKFEMNSHSSRSRPFRFSYLVEDESGGKIYWLFKERRRGDWCAVEYDWSRKKWVKVKNLKETFGNTEVFASCPSTTVVKLPPGAAEPSQVYEEQWRPRITLSDYHLETRCRTFQRNGEIMNDFVKSWANHNSDLRTTLIQLPQLCYGD